MFKLPLFLQGIAMNKLNGARKQQADQRTPTSNAPSPKSISEFPIALRLERLEEDFEGGLDALRFGLAWLMARTDPLGAIQALEAEIAAERPDTAQSHARVFDLNALLCEVRELFAAAPSGRQQPRTEG
jgi:hypothetical protein